MTIDWSKAPEGAVIHVSGVEPNWWRPCVNGKFEYWSSTDYWRSSSMNPYRDYPSCTVTPRPSEPKPYTRDEALQFLAERLGSWPTDIADAPLCPGWGWGVTAGDDTVFSNIKCGEIDGCNSVSKHDWAHARPGFVPFVSVEDKRHEIVKEWCEPATVKQPAPNGKGDPILGMVLVDLTNRALEGREKYGEALKANNGRNALWDAYQEALDLAMYLRQAIEEQHRAQTDR